MFLERNIPTLDLHGMDCEITRILVKEFVHDNYKLGNVHIAIVHGKGQGILKKTVHEVLKKEREVNDYYLDFFNIGCTFVELKRKN